MWQLARGIMGTLGQTGTLGPMSFGPSGHWGQMCTWGKWAPGKMSTRANRQLGQMGTLGKRVFGTNGRWEHVGTRTNGHLVPMSIGASGHWGQMGTLGQVGIGDWGEMATRKNEHQSKLAFMRQMGPVEQMDTLGPMDICIHEANGHFGTNGHWDNTW